MPRFIALIWYNTYGQLDDAKHCNDFTTCAQHEECLTKTINANTGFAIQYVNNFKTLDENMTGSPQEGHITNLCELIL